MTETVKKMNKDISHTWIDSKKYVENTQGNHCCRIAFSGIYKKTTSCRDVVFLLWSENYLRMLREDKSGNIAFQCRGIEDIHVTIAIQVF